MRRSLSARLALMFATCGAAVFVLGALALNTVLVNALEQQVREELALRASVLEGMVRQTSNAEHWSARLVPKIEALELERNGTRVWIVSESAYFRHGTPPPGLSALPGGFGRLAVAGHDCELVTLTRTLPAQNGRPEVQLTLAKDPSLFLRTLGTFRLALAAIVVAGVVLVAVLGLWIARMGLQPLRRLSRQARALDPNHLEQRLGMASLPPELGELTASFNGALERLEGAYKQLEAFNADVAHELRTPLMNLIGQTQVVLARPRAADELKEVMHSNLEELERLRAIVNDMLFLARADQGASARDYAQVSLAGEVAKVVEFLEPVADEAGVHVRISGDAVDRVETALFHRAVSNLLHNAIQHSRAGNEIVVAIEHDEAGSACVSVTNAGSQIEHHDLARLFDRFYRADSARCNSGGNHGLGLAIVKAIATMHRGSVFARSEQGRNTFGFTVAAA